MAQAGPTSCRARRPVELAGSVWHTLAPPLRHPAPVHAVEGVHGGHLLLAHHWQGHWQTRPQQHVLVRRSTRTRQGQSNSGPSRSESFRVSIDCLTRNVHTPEPHSASRMLPKALGGCHPGGCDEKVSVRCRARREPSQRSRFASTARMSAPGTPTDWTRRCSYTEPHTRLLACFLRLWGAATRGDVTARCPIDAVHGASRRREVCRLDEHNCCVSVRHTELRTSLHAYRPSCSIGATQFVFCWCLGIRGVVNIFEIHATRATAVG